MILHFSWNLKCVNPSGSGMCDISGSTRCVYDVMVETLGVTSYDGLSLLSLLDGTIEALMMLDMSV